MGYEQIWAPWRLGYILADKAAAEEPAKGGKQATGPVAAPAVVLPGADPECFLCQAVPEGDDAGRWVVCRGQRSLVVLNRYPYNNGHLLVAPRRHCGRLDELTAEEHAELSTTVAEMVQLLEATLEPEGFNVGLNLGHAAGAGLPGHLHWHIVPRWTGDTNFMPIAAAIRVIPQSLEALWEALRTRLSR